MSVSLTPEDVTAIIDTELDNSQVEPFIVTAVLLVNEELLDKGLSANRLKEIARWLAAHFLAVREPRLLSEQAGRAQAKYEGGAIDKRLMSTRYGQQAIALDPTGVLAGLSEQKIEARIDAL